MHNPAINTVRSPKIPHKLPRPLHEDQATDLIDHAGLLEREDWIGRRNVALFMLLYGSGLRINEALSLNVGDFPRDGFLRVTGKGHKERQVPVLLLVENALSDYLAACPYAQEQGSPMFLGARGGRLNQGVAQRAMRQLRVTLGLPRKCDPPCVPA